MILLFIHLFLQENPNIDRLKSINQSLTNQLNSIQGKVSSLRDQIFEVSGHDKAKGNFNFRKNGCIHLHLKELAECVPVLECRMQKAIKAIESWRRYSKSQTRELRGLQSRLKQRGKNGAELDKPDDEFYKDLQILTAEVLMKTEKEDEYNDDSTKKEKNVAIQSPDLESSDNKENNFAGKISQAVDKEKQRSTNASKKMNSKRNFDSVAGYSKKKDNVYLKQNVPQSEKDQWDFVDHDLPIIKKLKNN